MKHFLAAIPLVKFKAAHTALQVTPTESNSDMRKKSQSNVINYYYVGPNCKKLEQHLAKMKIESWKKFPRCWVKRKVEAQIRQIHVEKLRQKHQFFC